MRKNLLMIGLAIAGMLPSVVQAQFTPLWIDSSLSSVEVTIGNSSSVSPLSGRMTLRAESSSPLSGSTEITDFALNLDQGLSFSLLFGSFIASTSPDDVAISMVTSGVPGTLSDDSFDQLNNVFQFNGDLTTTLSSGDIQTIDLSTLELTPSDLTEVSVLENNDVVTVSGILSTNGVLDIGGLPVIAKVTYVASSSTPSSFLLGDVNLDDTLDFTDIGEFIDLLRSGGYLAEADMNQDGAVDFGDVRAWIDFLIFH